MTHRSAAAALLIAALLAACAITPPVSPADGTDVLSGRLSVRVDEPDMTQSRNVSAAFDLSGDAQRGELALSTPLGTLMARARWQPGAVALSTPQGDTRHADLASLTREVLGEELPVAAMFDWLRGRPWPDAASAPLAAPAEGFSQLGWNVDLARFADALVVARRTQQPLVTVRVKLDRP